MLKIASKIFPDYNPSLALVLQTIIIIMIVSSRLSVSILVTSRPKMTHLILGNINSTPVAEVVVAPGTEHFITAVDSLYGCEASRTLLNL